MDKSFMEAIKNRRSIYALSNELIVSKERIEEIVKDAIKHVPSAFNSQSTRIVILFGEHHDKLWQFTLNELKKLTSEEQFVETEKRVMGGFASGYGTVLFFEDQSVVEYLVNSFPLYGDRFPDWSLHTNAMHQFVIWTALEAEGLGASLQHYNPLIDENIQREWGIDKNWKLYAQLPFGKPLMRAGEKEFSDVEARVKVFK